MPMSTRVLAIGVLATASSCTTAVALSKTNYSSYNSYNSYSGHYQCNWATNKCEIDTTKPGSDYQTCAETCKPAEYARCNPKTRKCEFCSMGDPGCMAKDVCTIKCAAGPVPPPTPSNNTDNNYHCNWATNKCELDASKRGGTSLAKCSEWCKPAVYAACNKKNGKCE